VRLTLKQFAPEKCYTGHLTSKSDVYSFGVVLLEMLTGRRSVDKKRPNGERNLVAWARPHLGDRRRLYQLVDPRVEYNYSIKGVQKVAQIAYYCLSRDPKSRPSMDEVVKALIPLQGLNDLAILSFRPRPPQRGWWATYAEIRYYLFSCSGKIISVEYY